MAYFSQIIDVATPLKDAGAVTATGNGQVAAAAQILDMGAGFIKGTALITITTIKTTVGDERYTIAIQGSNSPTFASGNVNLAMIDTGAGAVVNGGTTSTAGFYPVPFSNFRNGTLFRYLRVAHTVAGTLPSVDYFCYLTKE